MNLSRLYFALTQIGLGAEERGDRRQVDASAEGSTCSSSGAQAVVALSSAEA